MSDTFEEKEAFLKKKFTPLSTEERYKLLIDMGRSLSPYPFEFKTAEHIVPGCQSLLYLHAICKNGHLVFEAHSDALISAGLAAFLIALYSDQAPEVVLKRPPTLIAELGLAASLSPNRSNGLANIHLRMKQEALKTFITKEIL